MKKIYTAINLPDATRVHALLEAAGIPCFVLNQYAAGALGEIPVDQTRPQVWIADPIHEAQAKALIQEASRTVAGALGNAHAAPKPTRQSLSFAGSVEPKEHSASGKALV